MVLSRLRQWAFVIKQDIMALYFAVNDPKTPALAKIIGVCVVVYAFSPIDLIPDFIPVLGFIDDLILLPIGIILTMKLIPFGIMAATRYRALQVTNVKHPHSWIAAVIIIMVWSTLFFMFLLFLCFSWRGGIDSRVGLARGSILPHRLYGLLLRHIHIVGRSGRMYHADSLR